MDLVSTHLSLFKKFANMNSCKLFFETANTLVVAWKKPTGKYHARKSTMPTILNYVLFGLVDCQ